MDDAIPDSRERVQQKRSRCIAGAVAANAALGLFGLVWLALMPSQDGRYAVLASNTSDTAIIIIARAGGEIVSSGASPRVAIAHSNAPDFPRRLYAAGALVVFNPLLATGCHS